jgi:hypothetical protein
MDKETTSSTHLTIICRSKVEGAWSLSCFMHDIHTCIKVIGSSWERTHILNTLVVGIEVAFSCATVGLCVDSCGSCSSNESAGILIEVIGIGSSGC